MRAGRWRKEDLGDGDGDLDGGVVDRSGVKAYWRRISAEYSRTLLLYSVQPSLFSHFQHGPLKSFGIFRERRIQVCRRIIYKTRRRSMPRGDGEWLANPIARIDVQQADGNAGKQRRRTSLRQANQS